MTSATQPPPWARWRVVLLASLALVLAVLLPVGTVSATAVPAEGTRVGASSPELILAVGPRAGIRAGHVGLHALPGRELASATGVAAEEGVAAEVPVNGETAATKLGRNMHKSWDYGPGFEKEFTLKAGGRVDGINFKTREIIELKPNNPRQIRLGERQLEGYIAKLNEQLPGDPWTGKVVTYP